MFQTFETNATPDQALPRVMALRQHLHNRQLSAFLIPRCDRFRGEMVAPRDQRLAWLTGFTGSAGMCAVTLDQAAIFTDGRYTLQVRDEVDADVFSYQSLDSSGKNVVSWLQEVLERGATVGIDDDLHTVNEARKLKSDLLPAGINITPVSNLVDDIWHDQPEPPLGAVADYAVGMAGEPDSAKRQRMAEIVRSNGAAAAVITLPSSTCWLLNLRGSDILRSPVVHAFSILHGDGSVELFVERNKIPDGVLASRSGSLTVRPWSEFASALLEIDGDVQIDPEVVPFAVARALAGTDGKIIEKPDPCILAKAVKNATEIRNTKAVHVIDGAAMCEFLSWVTRNWKRGLSEIDVVQQLEDCRRNTGKLRDISFDAIVASGPNAALCHYRVTNATNRRLQKGELLLIDSGGNYAEGTTDITRTIVLGDPTDEQRRLFTLVLKGLIALSRARWPEGTWGSRLDSIARLPLWQIGADYDHGTGHGVGQFLEVHEGPQRLAAGSRVPLQPGMILSIEPGLYEAGRFGIRTENLAVVEAVDPARNLQDRNMMCFDTLTYVPIDRRLIATQLLTAEENDWINTYHAQTADKLGPLCSPSAQQWLRQACAPL